MQIQEFDIYTQHGHKLSFLKSVLQVLTGK